MIIECPKCKKEKAIEFTNGLLCEHCKEDMSGYKYKKAAIATTAALILGVGGGHAIEKYVLSDQRYSLELESALLDRCRNGHGSFIYQEQQKKISEICVCALSQTIKDVPESDIGKDAKNFLLKFNQQIEACKK